MFWKKPSEYACPICGREPQMVKSVRSDWSGIFSFQCPKKHIGGAWFSQKDDAFMNYCYTLKKSKDVLEGK